MKNIFVINIIWLTVFCGNLSNNEKTSLNLAVRGLTNLNEIEIYKENVTELVLSFNKLTDIYLLANFTKLEYLNLNYNFKIKEYRSIRKAV